MIGRLVHFGAGNIGRSFIGQIFSRAGYEIVFVDVDDRLVESLNSARRYRVVVKRNDRPDETLDIENVRAVAASDKAALESEISGADVVSTSVGLGALPGVAALLARALRRRHRERAGAPLDIIIAENIRSGAAFLHDELARALGDDAVSVLASVGLVETSIGKMVPIMTARDRAVDPLWVFAEAYNTLIVDAHGFQGPIPRVPDLLAVDNITAYVDRKLFVHNLGHAATAYLGYRREPDSVFIAQLLENRGLRDTVRQTMHQSADALRAAYPDVFTRADLNAHIDDLLLRFRNRSLGDTVFRVGRDIARKLAREDRLVGAARLAAAHHRPFDLIADAIRAAVGFRAVDEQGNLDPRDARFVREEVPLGLESILARVCMLNPAAAEDASVIDTILGRKAS